MSKKRNNVTYVKPAEPAFLRRIKEKVGYKEGPTVETKRQSLPVDSDEDGAVKDDRDDEQPVVVVLTPGDLTQEEVDAYMKTKEKDEEENDSPDSVKITFRKPQKRESTEEVGNVVGVSTTKKPKSDAKKPRRVSEGDGGKVNNKCLLSFDDEEHDDDG